MRENRYGYSVRLSLRVRHPSISPEAISTGFKLAPTTQWQVGSEVSGGRTKDSTYWIASLDIPSDDGLYESLKFAAGRLRTQEAFVAELVRTGGSCELFVGMFLDRDSGDALPWDLLRSLGDMRIDLSLNIYCPTPVRSRR